jgi:hypothetical protein
MGRQARDPAGSAHVPFPAGSLDGCAARAGVGSTRGGMARAATAQRATVITARSPGGNPPVGRVRAGRAAAASGPSRFPGGMGTRAGHTQGTGWFINRSPKVDPERSYSPGLAPPPAHRSACHYWTALTAIPAEIADGRPGQRTDLQFLGREPWLRPNARAEDSRRQTARGQADRPQRLPWPHHRPITLGADPALASLSVISPAPSLRAPTRRYAREPRAFGPPPMRCRTAVMWLEGRR